MGLENKVHDLNNIATDWTTPEKTKGSEVHGRQAHAHQRFRESDNSTSVYFSICKNLDYPDGIHGNFVVPVRIKMFRAKFV